MSRAGLLVALVVAPWTLWAEGASALRLVGTVTLSPGAARHGHAIFEDEDGRQVTVEPGQAIEGCRLASVHPRKVVMECADGSVAMTLRSDLRARRGGGRATPALYQVTLPREAFAVALEDRQQVASEISLEPTVRDGWLYGYRVAWLAEGGQFHRLGLQADDVVLSLNGVPASTPGAFMQTLGGLSGLGGFQLTVDRSGRLIEYSYLFD